MEISRDNLHSKEHQLERSIIRLRKDLVLTIRKYGFSHSETLAISRKIDCYIYESQLLKQFKDSWITTNDLYKY